MYSEKCNLSSNFRVVMDNFQDTFISSTFGLENAYRNNDKTELHTLQPQYSTENVTMKNNEIPATSSKCLVCQDKATGKHYGAASCDGCKGFFRRSVRQNNKYPCRFQRNCVVDIEQRNRCRSCRLRKCYLVGMKREAVQNERDKTSRKRFREKHGFPNEIFFKTLLSVEMTIGGGEAIQIDMDLSRNQIATLNDIRDSVKQQLLRIDEWSKQISAFSELSFNDRIALLRARAGNHLLLGLAKRSLYLKDILVLANNRIIIRSIYGENNNNSSEFDINSISSRILDELVKPFTEVQIDDNEFACLKAIIFFDPNAKGLSNNERIRYLRNQIYNYLEDYINNQPCETRGRLGELLLTIPSLQSISEQMIGQIQYAKIFGSVQIDSLLQDILLGGTSNQFPTVFDMKN